MSQKNSSVSHVIPIRFRVAGSKEFTTRQRFHSKYFTKDGSLIDGLLPVVQAAHSQLRLLKALLKVDLMEMTRDEEELRALAVCNKLKEARVKELQKTIRSFKTGEFSLQCADESCPRYSSDGADCPFKLDIAEAREALPEVTNCAQRRAEDGTSVSMIPRDDTRMRRRFDILVREK